MARLALALAAFAGPLLLSWMYLRGSRQRRGGDARMVLIVIGALLAAETLLVAALNRPDRRGRFEPARLEDGVVQPGHVTPEPRP